MILGLPLFGLIIYDNIGSQSYVINWQTITTVSIQWNINEISLFQDAFLHDIMTYAEEDKFINLLTSELRKICFNDILQPVIPQQTADIKSGWNINVWFQLIVYITTLNVYL
jgi:hypothetical protein